MRSMAVEPRVYRPTVGERITPAIFPGFGGYFLIYFGLHLHGNALLFTLLIGCVVEAFSSSPG